MGGQDLLKKFTHGPLKLLQLSRKEVIDVRDQMQALGLGERIEERPELVGRSEHVKSPLHEEFGFGDSAKKTEVLGCDRHAQADEGGDAGIGGADGQSHPGSERESHQTDGQAGVADLKVIERGTNVVLLPVAGCKTAGALSHAPKIEAQGWHPDPQGSLRGAKHDLVVHGSAVLGMRVKNQAGQRRRNFGSSLQQCFERSNRTGNQQAFDFRGAPRAPESSGSECDARGVQRVASGVAASIRIR